MLSQTSELIRSINILLLIFCLMILFEGCHVQKEISIGKASWEANDNHNVIIHYKGEKYNVNNVKFEPNFFKGKIIEEKLFDKNPINFYVKQFTKSDSLTHLTIYYDDIEKVTQGTLDSNKTFLFLGSVSLVILAIVLVGILGVPFHL